MPWYAAHVIESVRKIENPSDDVLIYENVILVEAKNDEQALIKAEEYAKYAILPDETLTLDGDPAVFEFVGIRKIISVNISSDMLRWIPTDGTEISYSKFRIKNHQDLEKFIKGEPVTVEYLE